MVLLLKPGRSLPLYAGAEGRATLAFGVEDVEGYLADAPFTRYTAQTLITATELRRDVAQARAQGFAVSCEDVTQGIAAYGAPLRTSRAGGFAGVLSIAGLAETMVDRRDSLTAQLLDTAADLSATLP
jgi:DNA-binding IclR family transcriptional regulator